LRRLGDSCGICGHPGATDLDHIEPVSVNPARVMDPTNVRPAHGISGCPYCAPIVTKNGSKRPACNQIRGAGDVEPLKRSVNARGCPECRGAVCTNGVPVDGMTVRCW
jgi:hypothetical protein